MSRRKLTPEEARAYQVLAEGLRLLEQAQAKDCGQRDAPEPPRDYQQERKSGEASQ